MTSVKKGDPSFLIETYTLALPLIRYILGTIYDIARFKEYDLDDLPEDENPVIIKEEKPIKKQKVEEKESSNDSEKKYDENSVEYWMEMRKKLAEQLKIK